MYFDSIDVIIYMLIATNVAAALYNIFREEVEDKGRIINLINNIYVIILLIIILGLLKKQEIESSVIKSEYKLKPKIELVIKYKGDSSYVDTLYNYIRK
jgi:hypothetical protein